MTKSIYTSGEYLEKNPTWHVEDSPYKANWILKMLAKHDLHPETICEVGSGAGEILRVLQQEMPTACHFCGYDISPQAYELSKLKANDRLEFKCEDFLIGKEAFFDLILVIDLIEHLEDYYSFLRNMRDKSNYKIFHIPLDLFVLKVLFSSYLIRIRKWAGHIHYFTKELALEVLKDTGYEVIDFFYTPCHEKPAKTNEAKFIRPVRKFLYALNQDMTARIFGGFSLLVLAK